MELINREQKVYGVPAKLDATEPLSDIRCVWESSIKDRSHIFTVRGKVISRTHQKKSAKGNSYRLCMFGHVPQWVNEANIRQKRIHTGLQAGKVPAPVTT